MRGKRAQAAVWIGMSLVMDEVTIGMMLIALTIASVGLLPINFRLSRAMWINMFVSYEGPAAEIPHKNHTLKSVAPKPVALAEQK